MSDLVSGLQNRLERFDSATGLQAACIGRLFLLNSNDKYIGGYTVRRLGGPSYTLHPTPYTRAAVSDKLLPFLK